ncbi:MAG: alpha-mannosidase [Candidatus Limnocylindria bacterium]
MTPTRVLLVPHTHWDREWYRPFQSFRMQLVDLVDRVLDMLEAEPEFAFTLDGQLATVDDYLEIRPQNAERIARFVRSGRLAIGPWQILMDEFLVSGETLVRNLEMGWRRAEELGGPMRVGYLPDMFGHIAQMPQILVRAGLRDAVVWRGVPAAIDRHAFRWEAPSGSAVRAEYLCDGYGNAAYLFDTPDGLEAAAERLLVWARPWFGTDPVLGMYGTDHTAPTPELAGLVRRINAGTDADLRMATLADYIGAAPPLADGAPRWRGEMRAGARANMLMGVASAHMDIKQAAGRAERLLERYAEPLCALHLPADTWPDAFLRLAWRRVVENGAHDSICGCSVDAVAAQVLVRFAEAEQIAGSLARRAVGALAAEAPRGSVVVLNPSPVEREDVMEADLAVPDEWPAVALELSDRRRVATQELSRNEPLLFSAIIRGDQVDDIFTRFHGREIFDHAWNGYRTDRDPDAGRRLTIEVDTEPDPDWLDTDALRDEVVAALRAEPDAAWEVRIVARARRRVVAPVTAPALGWTAARPVAGVGVMDDPVRVEGRTLANGQLTVRVASDGTLGLVAADGTAAEGAGRIVDGGDFGDSYNYAPPAADRLVDAPESVQVEVLETGSVRGRLRVTRLYEWPVGVQPDGARRTPGAVRADVVTEVELRTGEPFVRLTCSFENRSNDHRVRCHVPLPRPASTSHAEGQFAVVERGTTPEGGHGEEPLATYPAHSWVDAGGMAVLLEHLTEYELLPAAASRGEVAITLLRSTGLISRNENPYRTEPAGPELPIPAAQLRGPWRIGFALMPHAGDWCGGGVAAAAERYRHAFLTAGGSASPNAPWPPPGAGTPAFAVSGDDIALSSLRRRPEGWLEARLVNLSEAPVTALLSGDVLEARAADLLGRPGESIHVSDGGLRLELGPAEIMTVQLRRRETARTAAQVLDASGPRQST